MSLIQGTKLSQPSGIVSLRDQKDAAIFSRFAPGEILEAVVAGPAGRHGVLVRLAKGVVVAETDIPLQVNERLLVKVEQLQPKVVLRILERDVSEALKVNDYLRLYRANPQALLQSFSLVDEIFGVKGLTEGLNDAALLDLQKIMKTVSSLILSKDIQANPFFLRDFISGLGLLLEKRLADSLRSGRRNIQGKFAFPDNTEGGLKTQLLRLFASLALQIDENTQADQAVALRSRGIGRFVASFIESIETLQVINVFYQESDHKYLLQIPCLTPNGLRMQDLVIELDGNGKDAQATGRSCRFVLFMDMDTLGSLMIDTALCGPAINCHIRCGSDSTADFLSLFLDQLKGRLTAAGYRVGALICETDGNIESTRDRYLHDQILHATDVVNLFA